MLAGFHIDQVILQLNRRPGGGVVDDLDRQGQIARVAHPVCDAEHGGVCAGGVVNHGGFFQLQPPGDVTVPLIGHGDIAGEGDRLTHAKDHGL